MIGVIVPVADEEELLGACLEAIAAAALHPELVGETVRTCVVLDDCADGSERIANSFGVDVIHRTQRNVGVARAAGATELLRHGARWLSFTDADSRVEPDWLVRQLELGVDAVCGVVRVQDWSTHPEQVRRAYESSYRAVDGHRHVHGANLGVSRAAYLAVGGFEPRAHDEDVALVASLERTGHVVAWSARARVVTSSRVDARATHGFGDTIRALYLATGVARPPRPPALP